MYGTGFVNASDSATCECLNTDAGRHFESKSGWGPRNIESALCGSDVIVRLMDGLRRRDSRAAELIASHEARARQAEAADARHATELAEATAALRRADGVAKEMRTQNAELVTRTKALEEKLRLVRLMSPPFLLLRDDLT